MRLTGMRDKRAVVLIAGMALVVVSCGADGAADPTSTTGASSTTTIAPTTTLASPGTIAPDPTPSGRYFAEATLLDKEGVGPQLCNFVNTSLPPQCRGLPVNGVDWDDVPGAESAGDTTWAYVRVVGTFDGNALTLTEPPTEPVGVDSRHEAQDFTSPCPEPAGGWAIRDPGLSDDTDWNRARNYAEAQPDFAGLWVDQLLEPGKRENEEHDATTFVANVTFTGNFDEHRAALEEIYGGPLCVSQGWRPLAELRAVQDTVFDVLSTPEAVQAGIYAGYGMGSSSNQFRGVVEASVMIITSPDAQAWVDEQFGAGLVEVRSYLQPVESDEYLLEAAPLFPKHEALPVAVWVAGTAYDLSEVPAKEIWTSVEPPVFAASGVAVVIPVEGEPTLMFFPGGGDAGVVLAEDVDSFVVSPDGSYVAWAEVEWIWLDVNRALAKTMLVQAELPSGVIVNRFEFTGFDIDALPNGYARVVAFVRNNVVLSTGDGAVATAAIWIPDDDSVRILEGYGNAPSDSVSGDRVVLWQGDGTGGVIVTISSDGRVDPPNGGTTAEVIDWAAGYAPTFSPDGSLIASGGTDGENGDPIVLLTSANGEEWMRMPIIGVPGRYPFVQGIAWADDLTVLVLVGSSTLRLVSDPWEAVEWGIYQCDLDDSGCHIQVAIDFDPTGWGQVALVQLPRD